MTKHRMNHDLFRFAARLRELIAYGAERFPAPAFGELTLELFALQFKHNAAYQTICAARRLTPEVVEDWTQIPAAPTVAFKELELSSLPPAVRTAVFHSSGTTEQTPSRHFHHAESLALYEASLWAWFARQVGTAGAMLFLTPGRTQAPRSSLVYMFDTVRRRLGLPESVFAGGIAADGAWVLDFPAVLRELQSAGDAGRPLALLGTAFSFVHLLDYLGENNLAFRLPAGSLVMETGGYKNRSRTLPKAQLHELITARLGVPAARIICEYGMSELSSQAYAGGAFAPAISPSASSLPPFHFPPWARVQIISPETGREVGEGQTGLIRVLDLANVFSVAAIQTEDLGVRRGEGFELIGRAAKAEPRGCSLMTPESLATI